MSNPLIQKVVHGEKLTDEELLELIESDRPTKAQTRVTGRKTRTGTQVPKSGATGDSPAKQGRTHEEKWSKRNSG